MGEVLFDKLRIIEKAKKTKTGQYVTSEEVLESLRGKHEIVGKILEHRGLKKLLGTYIDALPLLINPATGKIHTSFNQTVTATGRLSSSNPNLQNIPIRNEDGKEIRKAFIPEDGCEFFSADYSQIELRIMAHLSGDKNMIEAFREGDDIHAATAAKVYKIAIEDVTREQRSKAKTAQLRYYLWHIGIRIGRTHECPRPGSQRTDRRLFQYLSADQGIYGQEHRTRTCQRLHRNYFRP